VLTLIAIALAVLVVPSPWGLVLVVAAAVVDVLETVVLTRWSRRRRSPVGLESLVGRRAVAVGRVAPTGQVRLDGEVWDAVSDAPLERGDDAVVVSVDRLTVRVRPASDAGDDAR
jgi:membrane protein implicated in regulation of membrane protease activity